MRKQQFLSSLRQKLSCLPAKDLEERLLFYSDLIDDRTEDGVSQEDAIAEFGDIDALVAKIIADTPLIHLFKETVRPKRRMQAWEIVLLLLGFPLWLPLLIAAFAIVLSLYIALWSVVISLWAVFVVFIGTAAGSIIIGIVQMCFGNVLPGAAIAACGVGLAGLAVLSFFGCREATKGAVKLAAVSVRGIKRCFIKKKEEAQ